MKQKVLFTGATGLVGTAISQALESGPFYVDAISRQSPANPQFHWHHYDIRDNSLPLLKLLEGTDVILHNAASLKSGSTAEEREELEQVNVRFTERLLEAAAAQKVKKIIFTSSYSHLAKPLPERITEDSPSAPASPYAESKYKAEQLILEAAETYGIAPVILRISSPIPSGIDSLPDNVVKKWIGQGMRKETISVYGKGSRTQDFVSVNDVAAAFIKAMDSSATGIFNIASGNTLSMLELARLITEKFGSPLEFFSTDANENDRWNISIEKAKTQLGYAPVDTSESVIKKLISDLS